jgi:hypothetical protein
MLKNQKKRCMTAAFYKHTHVYKKAACKHQRMSSKNNRLINMFFINIKHRNVYKLQLLIIFDEILLTILENSSFF